ncbi:MAG: DUF4126 domain-containing protein [Nodosilinea sp.]
MTELLAVLAMSAALGLRVALPLLVLGLMSGDRLWSQVPILASLPPTLVMGGLVSGTLLEFILYKQGFSRPLLHSTELLLSPIVGLMAGIALVRPLAIAGWLQGVIALIGGLVALVIQLVQIGWFYRPQRPPLWGMFLVDALCLLLALSAFTVPRVGGLLSLVLLWLVIRTAEGWRGGLRSLGRSP